MPEYKLNDLHFDITKKKIKHVYLRVLPTGRVTITAPIRMAIKAIRLYVASKLEWIYQQQQRIPVIADLNSIHFSGTHYSLIQIASDTKPIVVLSDEAITVYYRPQIDEVKAVLDAWFRKQLNDRVISLVTHWQNIMGVTVARITIRKMKTRWGSCTPKTRNIRINLELITRPIEQLEYIVVHEMVHLLEPSHNHRFVALMNQFLPGWQLQKRRLNDASMMSLL